MARGRSDITPGEYTAEVDVDTPRPVGDNVECVAERTYEMVPLECTRSWVRREFISEHETHVSAVLTFSGRLGRKVLLLLHKPEVHTARRYNMPPRTASEVGMNDRPPPVRAYRGTKVSLGTKVRETRAPNRARSIRPLASAYSVPIALFALLQACEGNFISPVADGSVTGDRATDAAPVQDGNLASDGGDVADERTVEPDGGMVDPECPVLEPGEGWVADTPIPDLVGSASELSGMRSAIARWDVVPHQRFDGVFQVGVLAFHANPADMDRVEFAVNGGPWLAASSARENPRTGVVEYSVCIDASTLNDGEVELRAVAFPVHGQPHVLDSLALYANAGGSLSGEERILPAGDHVIDAADIPRSEGLWYVVRAEEGVAREDVRVQITGELGSTRRLRLSGVSLEYNGSGISLLNSREGALLWLDNSRAWGPEGSVAGDEAIDHVSMQSVMYWTEADISLVRNPTWRPARIVRNTTIHDYFEDGIRNPALVVNSELRNQEGEERYHPDALEIQSGRTQRHVIVLNTHISNVHVQGIAGGNIENAAFVDMNVDVEGVAFQIGRRWENVLFRRSTMNRGVIRTDTFDPFGVVFDDVEIGGNSRGCPNNHGAGQPSVCSFIEEVRYVGETACMCE